jgi:hypothetical protein
VVYNFLQVVDELSDFLGRDTSVVIPRVSSTAIIVTIASLPTRARCSQPSLVFQCRGRYRSSPVCGRIRKRCTCRTWVRHPSTLSSRSVHNRSSEPISTPPSVQESRPSTVSQWRSTLQWISKSDYPPNT